MHHDSSFTPFLPKRVIVAHSSALLSAGLAAILGAREDWEVHTWDGVDERMPRPAAAGTPILVGDAPMIAQLSRRVLGARVVLVARADAPGDSQAQVDAKLPLECRPEELISVVDRLCGAPPSPVRRHELVRGGLAPGALRRVREHVAQRLAERIEIRDLAAVARLSVCHFARAFRESTGVPPHRYVTELRVSTAAALVRDTDRPLTEIAYDVGFCDLSHFSRLFARAFGESPRAYRTRHR